MKIAVVTERIEGWRGGAETSTLEIAHLLAARGHQVHVITASRCPSPPDLTIHHVSLGITLKPLRTAKFVRRATKFVVDEKFDIVHAVLPMPAADIYQPRGGLVHETMSRNVALRTNARQKLVKRAAAAMNIKHRGLLDLEREVFRDGGPEIIAISQYVARQCEAWYSAKPPRVRVVFNGVQVAAETSDRVAAHRVAIRKQYEIADNEMVLVFVAHNFRLKGLAPLLEACGRLVSSGFRDFRLLIVGRDNPTRFAKQVAALQLSQRVIFTGPTQRSGMFLNAADVLVHPTYYDPCSRVVLEALAHGVPCITTVYNGASELMQDGREGYILPTPDDINVMAERIRSLASVELRRKMSENAISLRERISMSRHVDELCAIYEEVAAARKSVAR